MKQDNGLIEKAAASTLFCLLIFMETNKKRERKKVNEIRDDLLLSVSVILVKDQKYVQRQANLFNRLISNDCWILRMINGRRHATNVQLEQ